MKLRIVYNLDYRVLKGDTNKVSRLWPTYVHICEFEIIFVLKIEGDKVC